MSIKLKLLKWPNKIKSNVSLSEDLKVHPMDEVEPSKRYKLGQVSNRRRTYFQWIEASKVKNARLI